MPSSTDKKLKKCVRIALQVNDDIFLATITRVGKEKLYVLFDDGDTGNVSHGSKRILGIVNSTKRKSPVPKSKLSSYLIEKKADSKIVKHRQPKPKFTEEQLRYLNQYGWDMSSIVAFLKLPKYRDLFAFHFSGLSSSYEDLDDLKSSMLKNCNNHENKPIISKLTKSQIKDMISQFQKLGLINVEKTKSGFYIESTGKGRTRLVGLSWAKLYNYKSESDSYANRMADYYSSGSGIRYTGD